MSQLYTQNYNHNLIGLNSDNVELGANYLHLKEGVSSADLVSIFKSLTYIQDFLNQATARKEKEELAKLESVELNNEKKLKQAYSRAEAYAALYESTSYEPQTLRVAKLVCKRFPREIRTSVSFSHHRESLIESGGNVKMALEFLHLAERENLSVKDMRKAMRLDIKSRLETAIATSEIINDPQYIRARDAIFSIRRYLETVDSSTHPIARGFIIAEIESLYELSQAVKQQQGAN
jgi:hypothetical protein